ncbi:DUF6520 family protein [Flavobacterium sp. Fl-318]|uniref:DUF6520 family protein n=1 Tax=Flavobacterium cupriresistens TaxID=2893885 RepID=A0ABU4R5F4_9FLAO|nr:MULTISPECIES: DUF6520 family protein [unclassified Flavobacterium]MDX6187817.1 DUF6520 family protein [Flavobacterium sp. Fl-318]UFH42261.1 DUF6520 family protein [Flavobacterium sp. F-323]
MKTNLTKQVLPVVVFALATVGAFTTHAMNERSETAAPIRGYIKLNPEATSCEEHDMCSTTNNGTICRVGLLPTGAQLFGKNSANQCKVPVYKP